MAGMILAVIVLSALFENHIFAVSSLFVGFIAGAIPLIVKEEKDSMREFKKGILFWLLFCLLFPRLEKVEQYY